ncbi:hypothetical protein NADFUDRAFT_51379 [Nadsonia fulvescens var. elongata DSM 6958]|uniref:Uncharacterized protein n=1 Tax=Nadsonia fulvescens var. elongata DSM 6958 TaxID=857566 RepID=A0A1E3PKZ2_9ASCO|nr:hypothetical protein NADFUDRAFT_51379 [Nadsonia fulvescens var. elongata DSM 6958]
MSSTPPSEKFDKALEALLALKPPGVSGNKLGVIRDIATKNIELESVFIQKLYTHFKKTPTSHKLGAVYTVDIIARRWQEEANKAEQPISSAAEDGTFGSGLFKISNMIESLMDNAMYPAPADDIKEKMRKVLDIWEKAGTFPSETLERIRSKYFKKDATTTPPGSPPSHVINDFRQWTSSEPVVPKPSAPATDAASILQALASISNNKRDSAPPATKTSMPLPSLLPQNSALTGLSGQNMNTDPNTLLQILSKVSQPSSQAHNTQTNFSINSAWDSSVPPSREYQDRRDPRNPNDYRDPRASGHRSRSRSPPRNSYQSNNYRERSRSPPSSTGRLNGEHKVTADNTLPPGTLKVLSRTLFIGGVPNDMNEEGLKHAISPYARTQSIILNHHKRHAFVKIMSREEAVTAKNYFDQMNVQGSITLRARWGVGFGPRDCCDYSSGSSIIPISRLTIADQKWLVNSSNGGTGGAPITDGLVVEEPDIEIGSGVSSKAISKRMPTNGSLNGPRATRPEEEIQRQGYSGSNSGNNSSGNSGGYMNHDDQSRSQSQYQIRNNFQNPKRSSGSNANSTPLGGPGSERSSYSNNSPMDMPPNGRFQSNDRFSPKGFQQNGFPSNGFPPNGFPPNGFPPNGFPPNGFPPNGFPPNGFPPNGFPPNGFPPNGFPPLSSFPVNNGNNGDNQGSANNNMPSMPFPPELAAMLQQQQQK